MSICPSPLESSVFHSFASRSSRSLSVSPSIFQSCLGLLSVGPHDLWWYALVRASLLWAMQQEPAGMQAVVREHELVAVVSSC
jgi:hypothetical protein